MKNEIKNSEKKLFAEVKQLIEEARQQVSQAVSTGVTALYWNIGNRINLEILNNKRAIYGKQIVATLSRQLIQEYGNNFEEKNLRRMLQFASQFQEEENVATLWRQLSWSHFKLLLPLKNDLHRDFYGQMCRVENWNVRTLRQKIQSMLFERTAISKKPEELARLELKALGVPGSKWYYGKLLK